MATASISVPSRSTSWRVVFAVLAVMLVALSSYAIAVSLDDSSSKSTTTPASETVPFRTITPADRIDSVTSPTATTVPHSPFTPADRLEPVSSSSSADLLDCQVGQPC